MSTLCKVTLCCRIGWLSLIIYLITGCTQPQIVEEKWGWDLPISSKSKYETSLSSEYINGTFSEAMDEWRVLNYMMYFLATESAKWEGINSSTHSLLDQLQALSVKDDSTAVMNLYRKIFVNEDKRLLRGQDESNQFIDSILAQARLPQILHWGAFDSWLGLDGLGKLITRVGPLDIISFGGSYLIGIGINGITYKAVENEYSNYTIEGASDGPIDKFTPLGGHPAGFLAPPIMREADNKSTMIRTQHQLLVPADYALLDVQRINIIGLPGPENISVDYVGDLFYNKPWNSSTIDIELYFNFEDHNSKDSLDFNVTYAIYDLASRTQIAGETKRFLYGLSQMIGEAFSIRILSAPLKDLDSCRVDINISNNEQYFTHSEILNLQPDPLPIEIINERFSSSLGGLPYFDRDPIKKGDSITVFVPISDIPKNQQGSGYPYIVTAFLFDSKESTGSVRIDPESFEVHSFDDSTFQNEADFPVYDSLIAKFGDKYLCSIPKLGEFSKTYFAHRILIPDNAKFGENTLVLDFYRVIDFKKNTVSRFASATKQVVIE